MVKLVFEANSTVFTCVLQGEYSCALFFLALPLYLQRMAFLKLKNKLKIISVLQRATSDQLSKHPFGYDGHLWLQVAALLGFDLLSSLYNMGNTKQS